MGPEAELLNLGLILLQPWRRENETHTCRRRSAFIVVATATFFTFQRGVGGVGVDVGGCAEGNLNLVQL